MDFPYDYTHSENAESADWETVSSLCGFCNEHLCRCHWRSFADPSASSEQPDTSADTSLLEPFILNNFEFQHLPTYPWPPQIDETVQTAGPHLPPDDAAGAPGEFLGEDPEEDPLDGVGDPQINRNNHAALIGPTNNQQQFGDEYTPGFGLNVQQGERAVAPGPGDALQQVAAYQIPQCTKYLHTDEASPYYESSPMGLVKCPDCGESFIATAQYPERSKKYPCLDCGMRFAYPKDVTRHEVRHTRAKQFMCSICDKRYGRIDNLRRHVDTAHGNSRASRRRA